MSRDLVLCTLVLCVCGLLAIAVGLLPFARRRAGAPRTAADDEAEAWRRLWLPLLPASCALAALLGWAAQEPTQTDELLRPLAFALAAPLGVVMLRAGLRAARALIPPTVERHAVTAGLLRPHVMVSPTLQRALDARALAAVWAHERAHARHRDPLRVCLAQLATDLQWPSRRAAHRLHAWRRSMEIARDEEARREGTDGADLATAILAAARLETTANRHGVALTGAELDLTARIHRLLEPLAAPAARRRSLLPWLAFAGLIVAGAAGICFGDDLVRALPIVTI